MITPEQHTVALQEQEAYWRDRLDSSSEGWKKALKDCSDMGAKIYAAAVSDLEAQATRNFWAGVLVGIVIMLLVNYLSIIS